MTLDAESGTSEQSEYEKGFQLGWQSALAWAGLNSTAGPEVVDTKEQVKT